MEKFFKLKENGTNVRTEAIAGTTTFFTMAYIIFVNPAILSLTGMPFNAVLVATIISAFIGTLMMGLVANIPYAQAPGMGLNAFFTYTVCFALHFTWQQALAMVFICGVLCLIITLTRLRVAIIRAIPKNLQYAIGAGIGLFIAYIGFKNANFLKFTVESPSITKVLPIFNAPTTIETAKMQGNIDTVFANGGVIPGLTNFAEMAAILALIGLIIMIVLMALKVKGSILIGIVATTVIGIFMGITKLPASFSFGQIFHQIASVKLTFGAAFTSAGFGTLFDGGISKVFLVIVTVVAFSLTDIFDNIGTLIGTGRKSGLLNEKEEHALMTSKGGFKTRTERALFADMTATTIGAIIGTSNVTTYVESSAGISEGGRTGLTSVFTSILFALSLLFIPFVGIVPSAATAPALIIVGVLMMGSAQNINWTDFEDAAPAFFAVAVMPFAYSITYGIAAGFIVYLIVKLCKGKIKEIHPVLAVTSLLFIANFIFMAVNKL